MIKRREFLKNITAFSFSSYFISNTVYAKAAGKIFNPNDFISDKYLKDYIHKMKNFDSPNKGDVYISIEDYKTLISTLKRLKRIQNTVGHGHFYLLGFDETINLSKNYPRIGKFTKKELDFIENIFYEKSSTYGFYGNKPLPKITSKINKCSTIKIKHSYGNYLFKGPAFETYLKIKKEVGNKAVLTSGIRSVIKQFYLFLNKVYRSNGNLSMASRSLAPPGYSYHAIGDFDIGQSGFGEANFSVRFTNTPVYKKLNHLGFINLRYKQNNNLGVRFEPWHVKVKI